MNYYTPKTPDFENGKDSKNFSNASQLDKSVESLYIEALKDFLVSNQRAAQILPMDLTIVKTIAKSWLSMDRLLTNDDRKSILSTNISPDAQAILGIILFNVNNQKNEATRRPQENARDRVRDIF